MADEYRNGFVKRTENGVTYLQFERVQVRDSERRPLDQVWFAITDKVQFMPTWAELVAAVAAANKIQATSFAGDPPMLRALLRVDGYLAQVLVPNLTWQELGEPPAELRMLWRRVREQR